MDTTIERLLSKDTLLATVSGVFTTTPRIIELVAATMPVDVITTKSYQINANPGNREPIIAEIQPGSFVNAVGLRNPGMEKGYEQLLELRRGAPMQALLNVSVSADSIEGFITLVRRFEPVADMIELNLSCPHAAPGYGTSIGSSKGLVADYIKGIKQATRALIFPKLTPNVDNIGEIAKAAIDAGADGIVAINTVGPITHINPHTGTPVLSNNGKGGKSGECIRQIALEKVAEIRARIGNKIPVIGIGGVSTGEHVREMIEAGANVVGIGSAFARVRYDDRAAYLAALREDAETGEDNASRFLNQAPVMEHKPFNVRRIVEHSPRLRTIVLDGQMEYQPSQFAFLWVPGVGEKPYSIARGSPLTFIVRKREYEPKANKGLVSHALFQLKEGDKIIVRGVYGTSPPMPATQRACVVSAGTGNAVVPGLVKELRNKGKLIDVVSAVTGLEEALLFDEIQRYAKVTIIADNGEPARAIERLPKHPKATYYNIGPLGFMHKASLLEEGLGVEPQRIFNSIERPTRCGVGICGECGVGGHLTCQQGTFISLEYLRSEGLELLDLL